MASKSSDCRVSKSGLKPTYIHDNVGVYLSISCGSVTGFLYLNKLDESKKSLGKCILAMSGISLLNLKHWVEKGLEGGDNL